MDGSSDARLHDTVVGAITRALDPVLAPYGFATGAGSLGSPRFGEGNPAPRRDGQVIYCRAFPDGAPGCDDVVLDLLADPVWHVRTVRDGDDPMSPWSVELDPAPLAEQLPAIAADLVRRFSVAG